MSIYKKLIKEKKIPKPLSRLCFLDGRNATPKLFLNEFMLCEQCRNWIFHIKEHKYVQFGIQIILDEKGRRPIVGDQGIVECNRCGAFLKADDFRRHRYIRILKTQTWKLGKVLEAIRKIPSSW